MCETKKGHNYNISMKLQGSTQSYMRILVIWIMLKCLSYKIHVKEIHIFIDSWETTHISVMKYMYIQRQQIKAFTKYSYNFCSGRNTGWFDSSHVKLCWIIIYHCTCICILFYLCAMKWPRLEILPYGRKSLAYLTKTITLLMMIWQPGYYFLVCHWHKKNSCIKLLISKKDIQHIYIYMIFQNNFTNKQSIFLKDASIKILRFFSETSSKKLQHLYSKQYPLTIFTVMYWNISRVVSLALGQSYDQWSSPEGYG